MSDRMKGMEFEQLLGWIQAEHDTKKTVFGLHRAYSAKGKKTSEIFGRNLETVIGPAAGPNSQLAQNIIASYYAGARFFELKTVQKMDGDELAACVNKPCIKADDEGYNCEWSTELYVPEAQDEYIKAWMALHFMAREYALGEADGFQFNISVGYDLEGIKTPKIDSFIENMKEAKETETWKTCIKVLHEHASEFAHMTEADIDEIPSQICNSATISTLHGCPPQEIESIANYLINEKHMNTFIKCNPTLLGYDFARETLDAMGYDYVAFGRFHFEDDLQYADAIPMLKRLMTLSEEKHLEFGVKITNTFPVDVKAGELPSEEMYMSGRSLYPLSISLASELSSEFNGKLRISYSGGADAFNIKEIVDCGIWPVTVATTILKPGGYQRLTQMAEEIEGMTGKWDGINVAKLSALAASAITDTHHTKGAKLPPSRKSSEEVPLMNCYTAPCQDTCPIHQDIPTYLRLTKEGRYEEALQVITDKNALPFITGMICAHGCQGSCTRNFYDTQVQIRNTKLVAAKGGFDAVLSAMKPIASSDRSVAVIGGGPAGMAAAYYLARGGAKVVLYEKRDELGGIVRYVIPDFRIMGKDIDHDAAFLKKLGVTVRTGETVDSVEELKAQGYDSVVVAVGAQEPGQITIENGKPVNALEYLEQFNRYEGNVELGENVVVIGGGNTAMDTARSAVRTNGVKKVSLVYRRTKRYMPADEEELLLAVEDGVEFRELLAPLRMEDGSLICSKMQLGEPDASGRRSVAETEETVAVAADTVIVAVGEKVPTDYYVKNHMEVDERGKVKLSNTLESSLPGIYVVGDGAFGPSVVVKAMANAKTAAEAILGHAVTTDCAMRGDQEVIFGKKGILVEKSEEKYDERCLGCATVCENCVDVCPNRANISITVPGMDMSQIIHVDRMCNECGNCNSFCPYSTAPYKAKWTLFDSVEEMQQSTNEGFAVLDAETKTYHVRLLGTEQDVTSGDGKIMEGIQRIMDTVVSDYRYLI